MGHRYLDVNILFIVTLLHIDNMHLPPGTKGISIMDEFFLKISVYFEFEISLFEFSTIAKEIAKVFKLEFLP